MSKNNKAIVDLGSNTFHIIIADGDNNLIYRKRFFVALAENGIEKIGEPAIARGEEALRAFKEAMKNHNVQKAVTVGTSALRSAVNGSIVKSLFESIIGMEIHIIDGDQEAELIYKGVSLLMSPQVSSELSLIMDIGGGSTEFILCKGSEILFNQSFDLGGGTMYASFHKEEPFTAEKKENLIAHLDRELKPLNDAVEKNQLMNLIGSSGTFETLAAQEKGQFSDHDLHMLDMDNAMQFMQSLVHADYDTRAAFDFIAEKRAKLIPVSYSLLLYICTQYTPQHLYMSPYAIKEGLLADL